MHSRRLSALQTDLLAGGVEESTFDTPEISFNGSGFVGEITFTLYLSVGLLFKSGVLAGGQFFSFGPC